MINIIIWTLSIILLLFSLVKDRKKTIKAIKIAWKSFSKIATVFTLVLIGFALLITYLSPELIQKSIGVDSGIVGILLSLGLGSISVMPGFAAFPLCAALQTQGVPYYILAAFSLSLMNVGIMTFPIEQKFLGTRVAIIRNLLALFVCVLTLIIVKLVFGE